MKKRMTRRMTRTMTTILKVLNDVSYQEAMKELVALENPKATVQRFGTGWRIGTMGWSNARSAYEVKPVELEVVPTYSPNIQVSTLGTLASLL